LLGQVVTLHCVGASRPRCRLMVPPQSPCELTRPLPVKMLNSLRYLLFGPRRCVVVTNRPEDSDSMSTYSGLNPG
jgi:hypothetical protein